MIQPLLPRRCNRRGRLRADHPSTVCGILYLLRTGCRWQDLPRGYPHPTSCWRRLRRWQETGVWEILWQALLRALDAQGPLVWSRAFLDGIFVPAKKGAGRWDGRAGAKGPRGWWSATAQGCLWRRWWPVPRRPRYTWQSPPWTVFGCHGAVVGLGGVPKRWWRPSGMIASPSDAGCAAEALAPAFPSGVGGPFAGDVSRTWKSSAIAGLWRGASPRSGNSAAWWSAPNAWL